MKKLQSSILNGLRFHTSAMVTSSPNADMTGQPLIWSLDSVAPHCAGEFVAVSPQSMILASGSCQTYEPETRRASMSTEVVNGKIVMRAACNECRTRKLKCSGSRNGCDRCIRDRVRCVYSLQKKMGRPRKPRPASRPNAESKARTSSKSPSSYREQSEIHDKGHVGRVNDSVLGAEILDWLDRYEGLELPTMNPHDGMQTVNLAHCFPVQNTPSSPGNSPEPSLPPYNSLSGSSLIRSHTSPTNPSYLIMSPNGSIAHRSPLLDPALHSNLRESHPSAELAFSISSAPSPSTSLFHSPILSPVPPASTSANSPALGAPIFCSTAHPPTSHFESFMPPSPPSSNCDCIMNFLMSISQLKAHLSKTPIPFQCAISTCRFALSTASISLTCPSCQGSDFSIAYGNRHDAISNDSLANLFLGALLPMVCTFYSKAIESIDLTSGTQKVQIEGQEIEIGVEMWREMARGAMKVEARVIDDLVEQMEKISLMRDSIVGGALRDAVHVLWNPLRSKLASMVKFSTAPLDSCAPFDYDNMITA